MNLITVNKIKKMIEKADSDRSQYFSFESKSKFKIKILEERNKRFGIFSGYENKNNEREKEIEDLKKEVEVEESLRELRKENLYKQNTIKEDIYIKNKILYFFELQVSLNEEFLILKSPNNKRIYINLNQTFSFDFSKSEIYIKCNELEETIDLYQKIQEKKNCIEGSLYLVNKRNKYFNLLQDLIEIIILNKNRY